MIIGLGLVSLAFALRPEIIEIREAVANQFTYTDLLNLNEMNADVRHIIKPIFAFQEYCSASPDNVWPVLSFSTLYINNFDLCRKHLEWYYSIYKDITIGGSPKYIKLLVADIDYDEDTVVTLRPRPSQLTADELYEILYVAKFRLILHLRMYDLHSASVVAHFLESEPYIIGLSIAHHKRSSYYTEFQAAKVIFEAIPLSNVVFLTFENSHLSSDSYILLASILGQTRIQYLNFENAMLSNTSAVKIIDALPSMVTLTSLILSYNNFGTDLTDHFTRILPLLDTLTYLDIKHVGGMTNACASKILSTALSSRMFLNLFMGSNSISSFNITTNAIFGSTLNTLDLSNNPIDSASYAKIASSLPMLSLISLDMSNSKFGSREAQYLAQYLPGSSLIILSLHHNAIENRGAIYLANAIPKSNLQILNVAFNSIGSSGRRALSSTIYPNSTFQHLELGSKPCCGAI